MEVRGMDSPKALWRLVVDTKVHILLAHIFLWMGSVGLMIPHLTILAANDFASSEAGVQVHCEILLKASTECQHANARAVTWVAWSSFFQNAILGVWFVPLVGLLSDVHGRKQFMLAGQVLAALPLLWAGVYVLWPDGVHFRGYYVFDALKGAINPMSLCMSYAADKIPPELRATLFGWQLGTMSLAMIVSAVTGALIGVTAATALSLTLVATNLLLLSTALPESVSEECKAAAATRTSQLGLLSSLDGIREGFAVITRSTLFMRLAALMAITGMVFECLKDVLFNYLMLKLSFRSHDFAKIMAVAGVGSLMVQLGVLPTLLKAVGEKWVLVIALACSTMEMGMLAGASNAAMVYASIGVGTLGSMAFPGISALKSNLSGASEQGVVQGALFAARGFAMGIGPLAFSALFNYFTSSEHFLPGAPLIGAAVVMGLGFLIALSIHIPPPSAERLSNDLACHLHEKSASAAAVFGTHTLLEDADSQRLLAATELGDLSMPPPPIMGTVKSFSLKLQSRSSFSSQ